MLLGIFGWMALGIFAGFIATRLVNLRGDDPRIGVCMAVIGAIVGGSLYSLLSGSAITEFNPKSLFFAAAAAAGTLMIWHGWRLKSTA